MSEILDYEQIKQRYDGQWVIIAYHKIDEDLEVLAGEVLAHSSSETEIYQMLSLASGKNVSIEYIGAVPENVVLMSNVQQLFQRPPSIPEPAQKTLPFGVFADDPYFDEILQRLRQERELDDENPAYT
jgi:hypothetical protein